jgi:hypothetical protein
MWRHTVPTPLPGAIKKKPFWSRKPPQKHEINYKMIVIIYPISLELIIGRVLARTCRPYRPVARPSKRPRRNWMDPLVIAIEGPSGPCMLGEECCIIIAWNAISAVLRQNEPWFSSLKLLIFVYRTHYKTHTKLRTAVSLADHVY